MDHNDDVIVTVASAGQQPLVLLLQHDLVIGRDCEGLVVADSEVSRRHVRLRRRGRAVEVSDLGSTNGTLLEGEPITAPEMIDGDSRISIGDTVITVEIRGGSSGGHTIGRATDVRVVDDLRSTSIDLLADALDSHHPTEESQTQSGGTITMVFSDIESSTERAAELRDTAWFALLDEHNRLFRSELHSWGGEEVKSMGDGFMMTFPSVAKALRFTITVQEQVMDDDGPDLRVRMGLHTGEAISDITGDLFGRHVNMAARVANLAEGGQIMASLVVHEIAAGQDDIRFGEPILAELKGFAEPQTVYEVLWG